MQSLNGIRAITLCLVLIVTPWQSAFGACGAGTGGGNFDGYEGQIRFFDTVTGDLLKLLPRAMGSYIYRNRWDFQRGITFIIRDIESNPLKQKDLEEVRREAYARLMRDIPYCVEAFKGGELKLDTDPSNLAGRLGMIVYSVLLLKMPTFPDLLYQERFCASFVGAIADNQIDVWLFYDGYGDFHSLGELMERLGPEGMPAFKHVRNDQFGVKVKEDPYYMFRFPEKFDRYMVMTSVDMNEVYNSVINNVLDAFNYIWKCSGMELAHPSYAAPPGTVISRTSTRMGGSGMARERSTKAPSASVAPTAAPTASPQPPSGERSATEGTTSGTAQMIISDSPSAPAQPQDK